MAVYGPYISFLKSTPKNLNLIDVQVGSTINETISTLSNSNLEKLFLKTYVYLNKITNIQAGEYSIEKNFISIFNDLQNGKTVTHALVIPEGSNIYDLERIIDESKLINDCKLLSCIKTNLPFKEGILMPDKYFYKKNMKSSSILQKSHDNFMLFVANLDSNVNSLSIKDKIILASIIEKEAGNNDEKIKIANVFIQRIKINMRLQADPTIIYGLLPNFDGDIKKDDILDKNNIYNTYMNAGLPPTPISITSKSSIEAAFNGVGGDYLFFVANSPNSHYFSKTYQEHLNKINELGLNK